MAEWARWHSPLIPARGRQREVDFYDFEASLRSYTDRPCLKLKRERHTETERKKRRKGVGMGTAYKMSDYWAMRCSYGFMGTNDSWGQG